MLTSAGPRCDVCGNFILFGIMHAFSVEGIKERLMCHDRCKDAILACNKDWTKLPDGPLRRSFEKADAEASTTTEEKENG